MFIIIPNHGCRWDTKLEKLSHPIKHTHGDLPTALTTSGRKRHVQSKHNHVQPIRNTNSNSCTDASKPELENQTPAENNMATHSRDRAYHQRQNQTLRLEKLNKRLHRRVAKESWYEPSRKLPCLLSNLRILSNEREYLTHVTPQNRQRDRDNEQS